MINVFQPCLGEDEVAAVRDVFESNWVGPGPQMQAFEEEFATHLGVEAQGLTFLNSASSGLFLAMETLGVGPGDEVALPSAAFVANANAVMAVGATPVFYDIDSHTMNPSVEQLRAVLTPRTRAVTLLHYGGLPGDVENLVELCRGRDIAVVEDAACSPASTAGGRACGTLGDVGVWSFDSRKILTSGDGGMIRFRDPGLGRRARRLAYHGLEDRSSFSAAGTTARWWENDIHAVGRRLLGNDMTAAIARVQLGKLPGFVAVRRRLAELYDELLGEVEELRLPPRPRAGQTGSHYFYWVQMSAAIRDAVAGDLLERGIYTTFRYVPLHKVPLYGATELELPGTEEANETTLVLPLHQGLDEREVRTVAAELRKSVEHRTAT